MEYVTLNNGVKMPKLGFGVSKFRKKIVKIAYLRQLGLGIGILIRHNPISMKKRWEMPLQNAVFQEKNYLLLQRYGSIIMDMKKQNSPC